MSGHRSGVAHAVAWGTAGTGSALGLAVIAAWLITRAWQMPPVLDLSVAVVAVRALGISRGLCRYLERLTSHDVALRDAVTARVTIYRRLADLPLPTLARLRRDEVWTGIGDDIDSRAAVVIRAVIPIAVAALTAVTAIGLAGALAPPVAAALAFGWLWAGLAAPILAGRAARATERAALDHRGGYIANAVGALDHAAELRVAGRLDAVLSAAHRTATAAVVARDRAARPAAWSAAALPMAIGFGVLAAFAVMILGHAGTVSSPPMIAIVILLPLSAFDAVAVLPAAAQALNRVRSSSLQPALAAIREPACIGSDISLPIGRRIAVVGPSGAGKTTLLMRWAGLFDEQPHNGAGVRPEAAAKPRGSSECRDQVGDGIRQQCDTVFFAEDAHLFDTSLLENLRVARGDITEAEATGALDAVGLARWCARLPEGLHTRLVGGAAAVSGGQRRRILLARALLSPSRVLLLDEPTEHLDAGDSRELLHALLDVDSGMVSPDRTVVVVTHHLPERHRADAVVRLGNALVPQ